eukprot:8502052-Alexandrium_andersonii.AAC.1
MAEANVADAEAEPGAAPESDSGGGAAVASAGSAAARWLGELPEPEALEPRNPACDNCGAEAAAPYVTRAHCNR